MTDPTVTVLRDGDGNAHWTSPTSEFAMNGLADGTLTEVTEEANHATIGEHPQGPDAPTGGDDPTPGDDGPADGADSDTGASQRKRPRQGQPGTGG